MFLGGFIQTLRDVLLERIKVEKEVSASKPKPKRKKKVVNIVSGPVDDSVKSMTTEAVLIPSQLKVDNASILAFLKVKGETTSEEVFRGCFSDENEVPEFYTELTKLIAEGLIEEIKDIKNKTTMLKAV